MATAYMSEGCQASVNTIRVCLYILRKCIHMIYICIYIYIYVLRQWERGIKPKLCTHLGTQYEACINFVRMLLNYVVIYCLQVLNCVAEMAGVSHHEHRSLLSRLGCASATLLDAERQRLPKAAQIMQDCIGSEGSGEPDGPKNLPY